MTDYFKVVAGRRFYCLTCKSKFESEFHMGIHVCTGKTSLYGKPRVRLQNVHDEILYQIMKHLNIHDLTNFLVALPRGKLVHGLLKIWLIKYEVRYREYDLWLWSLSDENTVPGYEKWRVYREERRRFNHDKIIKRASERWKKKRKINK